jgi:hypothetical protein
MSQKPNQEETLPNGLTRTQFRRLYVISVVHYLYCIVTFCLFVLSLGSMLASDEQGMEDYFLRGGLCLVGAIFTGVFRFMMLPKNEDDDYRPY